jgi:hypothetical protein
MPAGWISAGSFVNGFGGTEIQQVFYYPNAPSISGAITATAASQLLYLQVTEFSGVPTNAVPVVQLDSVKSAGGVTTVTLTASNPTSATALTVGFVQNASSSAETYAVSGFTGLPLVSQGALGSTSETFFTTSGPNTTPSFAVMGSTANTYGLVLVSFAVPATGPAGPAGPPGSGSGTIWVRTGVGAPTLLSGDTVSGQLYVDNSPLTSGGKPVLWELDGSPVSWRLLGGSGGGSALVYRGAYDPFASYSANDAVTYQGALYQTSRALPAPSSPGFIAQAGGFGGSSAYTLTIPASTQVGDLILITIDSLSGLSTAVAGFTQVVQGSGPGSYGNHLYVYKRIAVAGDAGSTVTIPASLSGNTQSAASLRVYRAYDVSALSSIASSQASPVVPPSVTTQVANTRIVNAFSVTTSGVDGTLAFQSGGAAVNQQLVSHSAGYASVEVQDQIIATPGASPTTPGVVYGPGSFTGSTAVTLTLVVVGNAFDLSTWNLLVAANGSIRSVSATDAMSVADSIILANGTFTETLPSAASAVNRRYTVKNTGTGTITIAPASGTIDGAANVTLTVQYSSFDFVSDGTSWYTV